MAKNAFITRSAITKARERLGKKAAATQAADAAQEAAGLPQDSAGQTEAELMTRINRLVDERTSQHTARFDEIEERFGSVDAAFGVLEDMSEEDDSRIYDQDPSAGQGEGAFTREEIKGFRLGLAIVHSEEGWRGTSKELPEYDIMQRAYSSSDDAKGGLVVPGMFIADRIIAPLEAEAILFKLGATPMNDLSGEPVELSRDSNTLPTANWEGENTSSADTDTDLEAVRMQPHRMQTWSKISKRLLRNASIDVQNHVTKRLVRAMALKLDLAGFNGTGALGQPVGVTSAPGVNSVSWAGATYTGASQEVSDLIDAMWFEIVADNAHMGARNVAWAMHPSAMKKLRQTKDGDGRPIFFRTEITGPGVRREMFWDYPVEMTTQLTSTDLILGVWEQLIIGRWKDVEIDSNDRFEDVWKKNQTAVKVEAEYDIAVEHGEAFCIANSLNVS